MINLTSGGKVAFWENEVIATRSDWFYEVGMDEHSQYADPQFVDLDGPDNVLGYGGGKGLLGTYYATNNLTGTPFTTRVDASVNFNVSSGSPVNGLPADNFSIRWDGYIYIPVAGSYTFYERSDDGMRLYLEGAAEPVIDQWTYANLVDRTYTRTFANPGWVQIRIEHNETIGNASFNFTWSGPGITRQAIPTNYLNPTPIISFGNFGSDDNFAVANTSPAIDAGNPSSPYQNEPKPTGGRINVGGQGNTAAANSSSATLIQVLSPSATDKFEQGQTVAVNLHTSGLLANEPALLLNAGASTVGNWTAATPYMTVGLVNPATQELSTAPIDRSGVTDPIPEELYRTYLYASPGVGNQLSLRLPIPNGTYSLRFHFIEAGDLAVGARRFDIRANGSTIRSNYDIMAAAGARFKGVAETVSGVVVNQGNGLALDFVNLTSQPAYVVAVEILTPTASTATTANLAVDFSSNGGSTWTPIAGAQSIRVDRWGDATFNWTIPTNAAVGNNYRLRARSTTASGVVVGTSPEPFLVANRGTSYFISPTGDNAASGKVASEPMRSLSGLINAYNLDAGDVVNVAGGSYRTYRNIRITPDDSGVTIRGSTTTPSVMNRGYAGLGTRSVELAGADFVTIDRLQLTGGEIGLSATDNGDAKDVSLINSQFFGNAYAGIYVGVNNDRWMIQNNKIYGLPVVWVLMIRPMESSTTLPPAAITRSSAMKSTTIRAVPFILQGWVLRLSKMTCTVIALALTHR